MKVWDAVERVPTLFTTPIRDLEVAEASHAEAA